MITALLPLILRTLFLEMGSVTYMHTALHRDADEIGVHGLVLSTQNFRWDCMFLKQVTSGIFTLFKDQYVHNGFE